MSWFCTILLICPKIRFENELLTQEPNLFSEYSTRLVSYSPELALHFMLFLSRSRPLFTPAFAPLPAFYALLLKLSLGSFQTLFHELFLFLDTFQLLLLHPLQHT